MLKFVCKTILAFGASIAVICVTQQIKTIQFRKAIHNRIRAQIGARFDIPNNLRRCISAGKTNSNSSISQNCLKLVYEMNFDCSICLENLKKIHRFYLKPNRISETAFLLITEERSLSYVEYNFDQALDDYDIWIIKKEPRAGDYRLCLIDNENRIIMAGDIIKYPFLEAEYLKKLEIHAMNRPPN